MARPLWILSVKLNYLISEGLSIKAVLPAWEILWGAR